MREIKYRAWDKKRKKMCTVDSLAFHDQYGYKVVTVEEATDGGDLHSVFTSIEDFELMQYTGLKDKNGVEIYEGDIFKAPHDFGPGGYSVRTGVVSYDNIHGYQWNCWLLDELEVIGNIYDKDDRQVSLF